MKRLKYTYRVEEGSQPTHIFWKDFVSPRMQQKIEDPFRKVMNKLEKAQDEFKSKKR